MNNHRNDAANAIIIDRPIVGSDECEKLVNLFGAIDSGMTSKIEALDEVLDNDESSEEDRQII
jgi:hypothetical protein